MNKILSLVFALVVSVNLWASAGTGDSAGGSGRPRTVLNSSWQDVRKDPTLVVKPPQVAMHSGANRNSLSVFDICIDGNQVESIDTKPIYYAYPGGNAGPAFQPIGGDYWSLSVTELYWQIEESAEELDMPSVQVPVYDATVKLRWFERKPLLAKKPYEIPQCSDVRE